MLIVADTHVHLYPSYKLRKIYHAALANLERLQLYYLKHLTDIRITRWEPTLKVCFLAERHDCHYFRELSTRESLGSHLRVRHLAQKEAISIYDEGGGEDLILVAGRQVVTRERLEVLALTVDIDIEDGTPIEEVLSIVDQEGGVSVLNWAPGKWFFGRGAVIRRLIDQSAPGRFVIGDVTLRPLCWREPKLMARARKRGFKQVAGSDPLPFAGEESKIGQYGIIAMNENYDERRPVSSLRQFLRDPAMPVSVLGERDKFRVVYRRLKKLRREKKRWMPKDEEEELLRREVPHPEV